jgi:hypothetical protein
MPFDYTLPTTGAVSFSAFISTPPVRLNAPLAEAAAHRGRLRDILKRLKRADDKDILAVIKIIEDYLPYLFSVDHCLDHGIFVLDKEIGNDPGVRVCFLAETDSSDFMAMYAYRLKVEESAENRAANDIL